MDIEDNDVKHMILKYPHLEALALDAAKISSKSLKTIIDGVAERKLRLHELTCYLDPLDSGELVFFLHTLCDSTVPLTNTCESSR